MMQIFIWAWDLFMMVDAATSIHDAATSIHDGQREFTIKRGWGQSRYDGNYNHDLYSCNDSVAVYS